MGAEEPGAGARVLSAASSDCGGDDLGDSGGVTYDDLGGVSAPAGECICSVRCAGGRTCTGEAGTGGGCIEEPWARGGDGGGGRVEGDRGGRERCASGENGCDDAGGGRLYGGGGGPAAAIVDGGGESEGGDAISQFFKAAAMAAARYDEAPPLPLARSLLGLLCCCPNSLLPN